MRLSLSERTNICAIVKSFCAETASLYLYGSRTDDTARGGDIDLVLLVSSEREQKAIDSQIYYLLSAIKQAIGDQHIDFSVCTKEQAEKNPFLQMVLPKALLLDAW
jgi:hypothetical protein